jgi:histidine triad (HIT) family protein
MSCVFCGILHGGAPASFVFQDEQVVAFMDIRPARAGQLVVIPRVHVDHFYDLPDELAAHIMVIGNRIARALREVYQPPRIGLFVHGFGVAHAHLNIMPLHHAWDLTSVHYGYVADGEIRFAWDRVALADRTELDSAAAGISAELEKIGTSKA